MKKYFLKDTTVSNVDDDRFRYQDFANNLRNMIVYNKVPFNVAIIGKWGLGKTSLINLALAPLRKKEDEYLICEINAWKYEKDEIGKAFIKELYECIAKKKILSFNFFHRDYDQVVKGFLKEEKDTVNDKGLKNWKRILLYSGAILLISIVSFLIYCKMSNDFYGIDFNIWLFLQSSFLRYCKNIGSILIIPLIVWLGKIFMDKISTPTSKNYEISFPLETQADYEIYLEGLLDKYFSQKPNTKIIVTVDDLDRLSAQKIVEALDALKVFMEYDRFIFIVPFDDEILKNALDKNKLAKISASNNKYGGEMVLDKLFQYKMYLPQLIKSDMRKYAFEICKQDCSDFIREYCNDDNALFEEVVGKILIHNNVSTPRQVKKIINTFIENVMISKDREDAKKVHKGFASEKKGLQTIAKISVLQSDYNEFYDILFEDANGIHEILDVHRNEREISSSKTISRFFDEECVIKKEYEPLINFLTFTENLGHTNITNYLYMAQSETGVLVGDKIQQDFMAAIESCNFVTVKHFLAENSVLSKLLIEQLKFNESFLIGNMLVSAVECYKFVDDDIKMELAKSIDDRIDTIVAQKLEFRYDLLNVESLVDLSSEVKSTKYNNLLAYALECCKEESDKENIIEKIIKVKDILSKEMQNRFEKFTREWIVSKESNITSIVNLVSNENIDYIAITYGKTYIEKVANYITDNGEWSDELLSQFGSVIKEYLKVESIVTIEKVLGPCFEYPAIHKVLDSAISEKAFSEVNDPGSIVEKIVSIDANKLKDESSIRILSKLSYTIKTGEESKYDEFFKSIINRDSFKQVLASFAKNNALESIPNTINTLTKAEFDEGGYEEDICLLLAYYSEEQKQYFWNRMKQECSYSSNRVYENVSDLFGELSGCDLYENELNNLVNSTIIPYVSNYYNSENYLSFSIRAICKFKNSIKQEYLDKYSAIMLRAISLSTNSVVNGYRGIHLKVSESQWRANVSVLLENVSIDTYPVIFDILTSRENLFTSESNNLDQFASFLVDYIDLATNPNEVIDQLAGSFSKIGRTRKLISKIMEIDLEIESASRKISKFVDELKALDIINIIDEEWNEDSERKNKLMTIFSKSQKYSMSKILNQVNLIKEELGKSNAMLILEFCEMSISEENVRDFIDVAQYVIENYPEKDVYKKILDIISYISQGVINVEKENICSILADIFKNSESDEVKKNCAIKIKDKKLYRKIKAKFNDAQIIEYKSYIEK